MDEWEKRPGTKLLALMELLWHLLSNDDAKPPTVTDGAIVYPSLPAGCAASQQRKILVYYEYPMSTATIQSVMKLYGIIPFILNGNMKMQDRDDAVQKFIHTKDPAQRVLLFSSVGAAGLNLACADTVVLFVSYQILQGIPFPLTSL
jgi:TATA-binding protein-associated factor